MNNKYLARLRLQQNTPAPEPWMIEEGCEQPNGNDDMEDILRILSMKISVFYYRTRGFPQPSLSMNFKNKKKSRNCWKRGKVWHPHFKCLYVRPVCSVQLRLPSTWCSSCSSSLWARCPPARWWCHRSAASVAHSGCQPPKMMSSVINQCCESGSGWIRNIFLNPRILNYRFRIRLKWRSRWMIQIVFIIWDTVSLVKPGLWIRIHFPSWIRIRIQYPDPDPGE